MENKYLNKTVGLPLRLCLAELVLKMPRDPIEWMARWLYHFVDSEWYYLDKFVYLQNLKNLQKQLGKEMKSRRLHFQFLKRQIAGINAQSDSVEKLTSRVDQNLLLSPLGKVIAGRRTIDELLNGFDLTPLEFMASPSRQHSLMNDPDGAGIYLELDDRSVSDISDDDEMMQLIQKGYPFHQQAPTTARDIQSMKTHTVNIHDPTKQPGIETLQSQTRHAPSQIKDSDKFHAASPAYVPFVPWEGNKAPKQDFGAKNMILSKDEVEDILMKARKIGKSDTPSRVYSKIIRTSESMTDAMKRMMERMGDLSSSDDSQGSQGSQGSDEKQKGDNVWDRRQSRFGTLDQRKSGFESMDQRQSGFDSLYQRQTAFGSYKYGLGDLKKYSGDSADMEALNVRLDILNARLEVAEWSLDSSYTLVCDHPVLGTLSARLPIKPPETPDWWGAKDFSSRALYDPEVYSFDSGENLSEVLGLTYKDILKAAQGLIPPAM